VDIVREMGKVLQSLGASIEKDLWFLIVTMEQLITTERKKIQNINKGKFTQSFKYKYQNLKINSVFYWSPMK